jgi:hypothetical protein
LFLAVEIFSPDHGGKSYKKKLPQSMQVQKLTGLAQRLFNTRNEIPKLAYISSKVRYNLFYIFTLKINKFGTLSYLKLVKP